MNQPQSNGVASTGTAKRLRLIVLVTILLLVYFISQHFGLAERFDPNAMRLYVASTGIVGVLVYLLLFCAGLVLSVPGILFMVVAGLAWGQLYGALIALLGANLAIIFSFTVVRRVQGEGFEADDVNNRIFKKMLQGLEKHPVRTVALLRCLISTAPGLNYGFAVSSITDRQHLFGTLIGTIIPVVSIVWVSDWLAMRLF